MTPVWGWVLRFCTHSFGGTWDAQGDDNTGGAARGQVWGETESADPTLTPWSTLRDVSLCPTSPCPRFQPRAGAAEGKAAPVTRCPHPHPHAGNRGDPQAQRGP